MYTGLFSEWWTRHQANHRRADALLLAYIYKVRHFSYTSTAAQKQVTMIHGQHKHIERGLTIRVRAFCSSQDARSVAPCYLPAPVKITARK